MASRWRDNPLVDLLLLRLKEKPARVVQKPPEVSMCFVINVSGSMSASLPGANSSSKLDLVKQSVLASLDALPPEARVSVVAFDDKPRLRVDAASVTNKDLSVKIIDGIGVGGGTSLFPASIFGLDQLAKQPGDKFFVVLTDGQSEPPPPGRGWEELASGAARIQAQWTSIAVGGDADQDLLKGLADRAGSVFRYCARSGDVPRFFIDQANKIRRAAELRQLPLTPMPGPDFKDLEMASGISVPSLTGSVQAELKSGSRVQLEDDKMQPLLAMVTVRDFLK